MLVYTDLITKRIVFTDSDRQKPVPSTDNITLENGCVPGLFQIDSKMVAPQGDVNVYDGDHFGGGGDDEGDSDVVKVDLFQTNYQYKDVTMIKFNKKKDFKAYMTKVYGGAVFKALKKNGTDDKTIKTYQKQLVNIINWVIGSKKKNIKGMWDELQFWMGEGDFESAQDDEPEEYFNAAPILSYYTKASNNAYRTYVFINFAYQEHKC